MVNVYVAFVSQSVGKSFLAKRASNWSRILSVNYLLMVFKNSENREEFETIVAPLPSLLDEDPVTPVDVKTKFFVASDRKRTDRTLLLRPRDQVEFSVRSEIGCKDQRVILG